MTEPIEQKLLRLAEAASAIETERQATEEDHGHAYEKGGDDAEDWRGCDDCQRLGLADAEAQCVLGEALDSGTISRLARVVAVWRAFRSRQPYISAATAREWTMDDVDAIHAVDVAIAALDAEQEGAE